MSLNVQKDVAPAVPKSRCSSVDAYISTKTPSSNVSEYNDIPIPYREEIYQRLIDNGELAVVPLSEVCTSEW